MPRFCFDRFWLDSEQKLLCRGDEPVHQLGTAVAELLVSRLKGYGGPARHMVFPTKLVARASVAIRNLPGTSS